MKQPLITIITRLAGFKSFTADGRLAILSSRDRLFWIGAFVMTAAAAFELDWGAHIWLDTMTRHGRIPMGFDWWILWSVSLGSIGFAMLLWMAHAFGRCFFWAPLAGPRVRNATPWILAGVALVLELVALISYRTHGVNIFDLGLFHAINHLAGHHPWLDAAMIFFARNALELYAALFVAAWWVLPRGDVANRQALLVAGFAGVMALGINGLITDFWARPRPFVTLPHNTYTQLVPHVPDASFPSDHSAGSVAFAAASWGHNRVWIAYPFALLAGTVMFARVYVGLHWPTDVLGGMAVGILSSQILWRLSRWITPLTIWGMKFCRMPVSNLQNTRA